MKPPALARVAYSAADLVTAADTTPEHAQACAELVEKIGGVYNAGPFTPWRIAPTAHRREPRSCFPEGLAARTGAARRSIPHAISVRGHAGRRRAGIDGEGKEGSVVPYEKNTPGRSDVRRQDWRHELAVSETTMGTPDRDQHSRPVISRGRSRSA